MNRQAKAVNMIRIDKTLDIKGLSMQRPREITKGILENMEKGSVLQVIADCGETKRSIPLLCENLGCRLISMEEDRGIICFTIMR